MKRARENALREKRELKQAKKDARAAARLLPPEEDAPEDDAPEDDAPEDDTLPA